MNAEEKALLHRHLNGDLDASEQAAFFARLQSSPELRRELASQAMDEMLVSEVVLEGRTAARHSVRRTSWIPGAVAAALLLGLSVLLSLGRAASTGFRVVAVGGSATLYRGDLEKPVQPGTELRSGDRIATSRGGVTLEKPDSLLELRENTVLVLRDGSRLRMEKGVLEARADGMVIVSDFGAAQLRKATARVELSADRIRAEAEEGSIIFEPSGGGTVEVAAGQYVRFGSTEKVTTGRIVSRSKVDAAARRAAAFLESRRSEIVTPLTSEKRHGAAPRRTYAELALLALHRAGYADSHPMMVDLLGFVKGRSLESTYAAALQAMALAEIDPVAHRDRIRQCGQFLVDSQCANGQWDYHGAKVVLSDVPSTGILRRRSEGPPSGDNSVSSYAALGLYACAKAGEEIDRDVVFRASQWWQRCQNGDGGWGYNDSGDRTANDGGKGTVTSNASYGSATASALAALTALERMRGSDPRLEEIRRGEAWLAANFAADHNPRKDPGFVHVHWLVAASRAGDLLPTERFGSHEWYPEGADYLLAAQRPTGEWQVEQGEFLRIERNDVLDTCLAILFLRRAP
jgi:hypothetical protein